VPPPRPSSRTGSLLPPARVGPRELAGLLDGWRDDLPGAPGYASLAARLRTLVLDGRLPLNTVLPSERALAVLVGASRTLTTATYALLREEGFAVGRHGSGTWTALPGAHAGRPDQHVWLAEPQGVRTGDLSTAAPEAPPELYGALVAAIEELPRLLPGHGYEPAGLPELRAAIAARYTARGLPTSPAQVMVTAGAQQGLRLALAVTTRPGDRVLVEDPSWPQALDATRALGARPVGLGVEEGWEVDAVRAVLRRTGARAAYLMPDGQNPTGRLLAGDDRARLADVLADAGCAVIVDETLAELDLRRDLGDPGAVTPPPFGTGRGDVLHVGSTSKVIWGGLRVGWVRADAATVRRLVTVRVAEDLGGPPVEQLAAAHLLDPSRFGPLVARRRAEAAHRCRTLQAAVARELPSWRAEMPQAGLSLWFRLPGRTSVAISQAARAVGMTLPAGQRFGVDGGFPARLRLTFSAPPDQLEDAVRRLAGAVHALADGPEGADTADTADRIDRRHPAEGLDRVV